jgi:hypothetical protein
MRPRRSFFTLTELMLASGITVIMFASILPLAIIFIKSSYIMGVKVDLREQVNKTRGTMAADIRCTSRGQIVPYPDGNSNLTALAMPIYMRPAGSTTVPISTVDNTVQWSNMAIYHIYAAADGTTQLRRTSVPYTSFNNLSASGKTSYLGSLVANGDTTGLSPSGTTRTLMKGIKDYMATLGDNVVIDGYSPTVAKATVAIGTAVLDPAVSPHTITFTVAGKNSSAGGYKIGLDSFVASATGLPLEGESATVTAASPSTSVANDSTSGWSNNQYLDFPATATGRSFTVNFTYDTWEESNFNFGNYSMNNTRVDTLSDNDLVVTLLGNPVTSTSDPFYSSRSGLSISWQAPSQGTGPMVADTENLQGSTVRVVVRGGAFVYSGRYAKLAFQASPGSNLTITSAYIMKRSGSTFTGVSGTPVQIKFGGANSVTLTNGETKFSDVLMPSWAFDKAASDGSAQDYLVSFHVSSATPSYAAAAPSVNADTSVLPNDLAAYESKTDWPTAGTTNENLIVGVAEADVTYPASGTYTSQIADTKLTAPAYSGLSWTTSGSGGASIKLRSGSQPDLSDASGWTYISSYSSSPATLSTTGGRYVQFQAAISTSDSTYKTTPALKNVKVTWQGEKKMVQLSADIRKGPMRGMFNVKIDGVSTANPLLLLMQFNVAKTFLGKEYTDGFTLRVKPQNQ